MAELGGLLFLNGRYRSAARYYRRSLDLGEDPDVGCRLADALLFSGQYDLASELFRTYADAAKPDHAEWRLKALATLALMHATDVRDQRRDQTSAAATMSQRSDEEATCRKALQYDALSGHAWFNLGVLAVHTSNHADAMERFLLSAVSTETDAAAWCNVVITAVNTRSELVMYDALAVAHRLCGAAFLAELHVRMLSQFKDPADGSLISDLAGALEALVPREEVSVRFNLDGGGFAEFRAAPTDE